MKHLLVAPLDWGLGHTTRCIPLIRHLIARGHRVIVAGNAAQRAFLAQAFPGPAAAELTFRELEGYDIHYGKTRHTFLPGLLLQVPRLLGVIRREHGWLQALLREQRIDGIISDNRYGLYHADVPSVILTHQLQVRTGLGAAADALLRSCHYKYLQRFGQVWVPDVAGVPNLSGALGHPAALPAQTRYIGLLPQVTAERTAVSDTHLLILLSGPEPQRGMLSAMLWRQVADYPGKVVFVEGSAAAPVRTSVPAHVSYHRQLPPGALQEVLAAASMVVCRSGYSTLMDLLALGKKAILIPTPGQTEQEYLGRQLHRAGMFYCHPQRHFRLQQALTAAAAFPFRDRRIAHPFGRYAAVADEWLGSL